MIATDLSDGMTEETLHETEKSQSRNRIATFFTRIAGALRRGEKVPVDDEGTVAVDPPAETDLEVELERVDEEVSLEIEMAWDETEGDVDMEASTSKATFERYEDNAGQYRWRLVHDNGNIIADGSEGYASKQKATQGLESVRENAPGAPVVDISKDETADQDEGSSATFELFEDDAGQYRWRLVHDNGEIIADGGQGYSSKQKAKQGLESVKTNVSGADVTDVEA